MVGLNMTTFYIKSKIKKIVLAFLLFTSAILCFAETNLEKADSYYDKDSYSVAKIYYEYSLFNDNVSNGRLFYRLGYSYEQLKINKAIYPKLYSAAAYCFERDNDKDNKYYAYALSKEKEHGINHNNFNEETIKAITDELYWNTHKNTLAYFKEFPEELVWYLVMLLIAILLVVAFIYVLIKHFSKNKYYLKNIDIDLSELFKMSNFTNTTSEFNDQLQNSYNNMVKCARYDSTKISKPENFLLYKFGQVIFTKNGNEVDYETVTKGLKQVFFTETNTIESSNLKINFINKFNEFYHRWHELQKLYDERLYELPELGILLSVLFTKMENETFIKNSNNVIDVSNDFEKYKIKSYRNDLIIIANKIYHEKSDEHSLSSTLAYELNTINEKFSNKIKLITAKFFKFIVNYLPIILFIYAMVFIIHTSSLSLINFIVTGICCFIVYKIKSKLINPFAPSYSFSKLMTKAEREALDREIKEQEERDKARRAREQEQKTYSSSSNNDEYYERENYQEENQKSSYFSSTTKEEKHNENQKTETPKTEKPQFFCKYCGKKYGSISSLTSDTCYKHPYGHNKGKHDLYQGPIQDKYFCEYCGKPFNSLSALTSDTCYKHPAGHNKGYHLPYEGGIKSKYYCKRCGKPFNSLSSLTSDTCYKHPNGHNKGYHSPAR